MREAMRSGQKPDKLAKELGKDREQLRAIKKELGEDNQSDEVAALKERLEKAGLPPEAKTIVDRELIEAQAPPAKAMARCPASWKRRSMIRPMRLPTCRLSAVGSKPQ